MYGFYNLLAEGTGIPIRPPVTHECSHKITAQFFQPFSRLYATYIFIIYDLFYYIDYCMGGDTGS